MKLARVGNIGAERSAPVDDDMRLHALDSIVQDIGPSALSPESLAALAQIDPSTLALINEPLRYGPPIAGIGKIVAIGLNYTDHAAEAGDIIATGTPAGVGLGLIPSCYLKVGDEMHLRIAGLGEQRQIVMPFL